MDKQLEQQAAVPEERVQAQQPVRDKLDNIEKHEIVHQVLQVFKTNNLCMKQCRDMLTEVSNALDTFRPWKF